MIEQAKPKPRVLTYVRMSSSRQKDSPAYQRQQISELVSKAGFSIMRSYPESVYRFPIKTFSRNICLLVRKPL